MAMGAAGAPRGAERLQELEQENAELREQLRKYAAAQTVTRGAVMQAAQEREATERIAHQLVVEEQATRAAVEVQTGNTSFAGIMQIVNFFVLIILLFGLFFWLPREVQSQSRVVPNTSIVAPPGSSVTVPGGTNIIPALAR